MSNSINSCHLSGRLGKDPASSYMPSGTLKATFSIAVDEEWKDRTTGEKKSKTSWVNIEAFGAVAEKFVMPYFHKGDEIYVEGKLEIRSYDDNGVKKYFTSVKADHLKILSHPKNGNGAPATEGPMPEGDQSGPAEPDVPEDDIPF